MEKGRKNNQAKKKWKFPTLTRNNTSIWKFLLAFILFVGLFYFLYSLPFVSKYLLEPFINFQANLSGFIIDLFFSGTSVNDGVISHESGSINVAKGCDGIEPIMMYIIGVSVIPVAWKLKLTGLLWGILVLLILNFVRIIGLFFANIYAPSIFEELHLHGGFAIFIFITFIVWLVWANWAIKKST